VIVSEQICLLVLMLGINISDDERSASMVQRDTSKGGCWLTNDVMSVCPA